MALRFLTKLQKKDKVQASMDCFSKELLEMKENLLKTKFEVKYAAITPEELSELASLIKKSKTLSHLALVGCRLNNASSLTELLKAIKRSKSILSIDLSDNEFGDVGVKLISEVIQLKSNIKELHLSNCNITMIGCKNLKTMLEYNKKIRALDLSNNDKIGNEGLNLVCRGLLDTPLNERSSIEELDVSECSISDSGCKMVGSLLSSCDKLIKISIADNEITSIGTKAISYGLLKKTNGSSDLELLNISGNPLRDEGVKLLAKKLGQSGCIRSLLINEVGMTETSVTVLCEAVIKSNCVTELGIAGNRISDGVSIVSDIIKMAANTSSLKELDISKMKLSSSDIKDLGDFLGQTLHCTLTKLSLAQTEIDNDGAVEVANGLKMNMELNELDVTSNPFNAKGAKAFAKVFKRAKELKMFRVTGQSRITAEGENYLADALRYNKKLEIKGASVELDYLCDFAKRGGAFEWSSDGKTILGWSNDAWEVVKRGCGQIIATAVYSLTKEQFAQFKRDVLTKDRNVVNQDMFEYVIRHTEAPALDVVSMFVNKCMLTLDTSCESRASKAMSKEQAKSDDVTYRFIAKDHAKDEMVREMAKNNRLFLGRYLTEYGPPIHETSDVTRFLAKDKQATGKEKEKKIFVQIYEDDDDFRREWTSRTELKEKLSAAGPFAIYDVILKEIEVHEDNNCVSFQTNLTDLRHSINNLGVTSGYNLQETTFLVKRAAQCLSTINGLGRIHGDFRPRNFLNVAKKRFGSDPLGKTNKKVPLPEKWILFDFSKSVPHETMISLRKDSGYLPPEVARVYFHKDYSQKILPLASEKIDVWSFGCVLYQLLTGVHLFHLEQNTDKIYKQKERLELMNWINLDKKRLDLILHRANESIFKNETTYKRMKAAAIDLVNWCLQGDPFNRPTFNDILSHPFFYYKTNVNYTDLDLLLGWYKKIGSDQSVSKDFMLRNHSHIINTVTQECSDVFQVLKLYLNKVGCSVSNDANDLKLDVSKRKEQCQKSRSLIVLLTKDVFWRKEIIQKILWARDSNETTNFILIDVSTAFTKAEKFDFEAFKAEMTSPKLDKLVESLLPLQETVALQNIRYEKNLSKQKKWLKEFILQQFEEYILPLESKVVPYRTREFQTRAMIDEILDRSGFIASSKLREFNLFYSDNIVEEKSAIKEEDKVKVLILAHLETTQVPKEKLMKDLDALKLTLDNLLTDKIATETELVTNGTDLFKHFEITTEEGLRNITAEKQTLVFACVTDGFYEEFRETIVLLDSAKGLVSVVPIKYGYFDVMCGVGKEEVLNLGLENKEVLERLKDNKSYIPLPTSTERLDLEYETKAALEFIQKEAKKVIELTRENETKDENEVYAKYTHTNFFEAVY